MSTNATESPDSAARYDLSVPSNSSENNSQKIQSLAAELYSDINKSDITKSDSTRSDSNKKAIQAVRDLAAMKLEEADSVLVDSLQACVDSLQTPSNQSASQQIEQHLAVYGCAYQQLYASASKTAKAFIKKTPNGIAKTASQRDINYSELQELLIQKDYQAADKLTTELMCAIAGESAIKRKWVYFTEVSQFPNADMLTINRLWRAYSEDKFGWSQQRHLWIRLGRQWERLWPQLKWQQPDGNWTRYPTEFIWELDSAPVGHLPLSNQLRGVRVMDALLEHPAWFDGD